MDAFQSTHQGWAEEAALEEEVLEVLEALGVLTWCVAPVPFRFVDGTRILLLLQLLFDNKSKLTTLYLGS